jgi:hypothetical protein
MLTALSCRERGERRINACKTISRASQSAVKICSRHEDKAARLVETHLHAPSSDKPKGWRLVGGTGVARSLLVLPWRVSKPLGIGDGRQPFDIGISSRADRTGRLPQQRNNFGFVPPQTV